MGQKVHPYGFRLGFNKPWRSRWFAGADYAKLLREDLELKENLRSRLKSAGVSSIEVDRPGNKLRRVHYVLSTHCDRFRVEAPDEKRGGPPCGLQQ